MDTPRTTSLRSSFQGRLWLLALVSMLPFASLAILSVRDLSSHYRAQAFERTAELARSTGARVDHFIEGTEQLLDAIGVLVAEDNASGPTNNAKLQALKAKLPPYIKLLQVISKTGDVVSLSAAADSQAPPYNVADRKYFKEAMAKRRIGFGEPVVSRATGKMSLALARPIIDAQGAVEYVVTLSILVENFQEFLLTKGFPDKSEVTLLDETGMVIARSLDPTNWIARRLVDQPSIQQMFRDKQGSVQTKSLDDVERFYSYTTTQRAPWMVYVGIPKSAALAPVQESLNRLWWIAAATVLLALGLGTAISRRIAEPIRQLSADVRRFASGDLAHRTAVKTSSEVGGLAEVFNNMAANLEHNTAQLRESEARYDLALEATTDGLWEINLTTQTVIVSPKVKGLLGYTDADIPNERGAYEVLLHPDDRQRTIDTLDNHIKYGTPLSDEFRIRAKDGSYRWVSRRGKSVRDTEGKVVKIVGSISDITARRKAELEVQQLNTELEQRVVQRTADLTREIAGHQATQRRLEEANRELRISLDRVQQQTREMELLHEMSELLQGAKTSEEYNKIISHAMQQLFNAKAGGLYAIRSSRDLVEASITWGKVEYSDTVFHPEDCWALKLSKLHFVANRTDDVACRHVANGETTGYVCVPLNSHGETQGLIHLRATTEAAKESLRSKLPLIHTVSEYLGLALGNFRLQQTLRYQSVRDSLTGLFNRRYLEESIAREVARVARDNQELGIIMFDLDHFKRVNDDYGHDMGDAVLRQLGEVLLHHVREEDIACRYGGEEFTVILPGANTEVSRQRAEELRQLIEDIKVQWGGQVIGDLSVSLGVACFPTHGKTWQDVLKAADQALYQAKQTGRKRVVVAPV